MAIQPVPEGFNTVTPYLIVRGASDLLDFLKRAFGAEEMHVSRAPDGSVPHATVRIGSSAVMLGDTGDRIPAMPCMLYLYVEDADALYRRALEAGGTSVRELTDEFYGDRVGGVQDPAGNQWWIATHVEDVSPEEMARRAAARGQGG